MGKVHLVPARITKLIALPKNSALCNRIALVKNLFIQCQRGFNCDELLLHYDRQCGRWQIYKLFKKGREPILSPNPNRIVS